MANVNFERGDNAKMAQQSIMDGLIFLNTEEKAIYLDNGNERLPMGGGGAVGHIIENSAGTDMTERTNLRFYGVYVEDDEVNDRTQVNVARNMTKSAFDQLTDPQKLGIINTTSDDDDYIPFSADMVKYDNTTSGMTATNTQEAIDELNADITDVSDRVDADTLGTAVNITAYTSANQYICPSDGYVMAVVYSESASNDISININGLISIKANGGYKNLTNSVYVKKGMSVYCIATGNGTGFFCPLT